MGTALQSVEGDSGEKADLEELLKLIRRKGFDRKKRIGVELLIAEVVNDAIFGAAADAETKRRVTTAVQGKVMDEVITKYKQWRVQPKKRKWPFQERTRLPRR